MMDIETLKKSILSLVFVIFAMGNLIAQDSNTAITMEKTFGGYYFMQDGNRLKLSKVVKVLEVNEAAYAEIKMAKKNNVFASILGGVGGFMLGWELGGALAGGEVNWAVAGVGTGLLVVSFPLISKSAKQANSAIGIYNESLNTSLNGFAPELNFSCTSNGLGLMLKF